MGQEFSKMNARRAKGREVKTGREGMSCLWLTPTEWHNRLVELTGFTWQNVTKKNTKSNCTLVFTHEQCFALSLTDASLLYFCKTQTKYPGSCFSNVTLRLCFIPS